jgi:phosphohistidine phosphatase SixA
MVVKLLTKCKPAALLLGLVALIGARGHAAGVGGAELVAQLRQGGFVILMRHASSPRVLPDSSQANPDNTEHERQLDLSGRLSATAMGDALRQLGIPIGSVLSSPTYRALETVRLAQFGYANTFDNLGDSGQSMQADPNAERASWLRTQTATRPAGGTNTIIVTHLPNISEAFPKDSADLSDGEALIFRPDGRGAATIAARVRIAEWPQWAAAALKGKGK